MNIEHLRRPAVAARREPGENGIALARERAIGEVRQNILAARRRRGRENWAVSIAGSPNTAVTLR